MSLLIDAEEVREWWTEANDDPSRMAHLAVSRLSDRAAAGDANAQTLLDRWTLIGARQDLKGARRELRQVHMPKSQANGHSALPTVVSVRQPDGSHQLRWLVTLTYAEFGIYVEEYRAHHRTRTNVLRTLEALAVVWSQHPDVLGEEACRMAGIDPEELAEAVAI